MPGKVKVKIISGKDLPVMDRSNDTTDAYVEVKLGSTTFKTDVCRKSLNPQWDSEWFRFEMDDLELQDEPLQIRLMDHDTYSANDAIGKVYLDLNPLLLTSSKSKDSSNLISGWIPVYDTMHGIRGEVLLIVKVELFSDLNKFRQSSCGVKFFFTQAVPDGYFAHSIHGFVEELVVNDDPEYQWIDKIRTPRASNEARQTLFSKLSGEVQRRVGLKALELGGNAVIGYRQCFDLEGESGIVVRGIGTAATLTKQFESQLSPSRIDSAGTLRDTNLTPAPRVTPAVRNTQTTCYTTPSVGVNRSATVSSSTAQNTVSSGTTTPSNKLTANSPAKVATTVSFINRRSSESDLCTPPKPISTTATTMTTILASSTHGKTLTFAPVPHRRLITADHFEMLEYPFITLNQLPHGFIQHLGGTVSARSVKLLERISNLDEPESRDSWWTEIRMEIRSHARAIGCNVVLGYEEQTTMCDDVCVLSASGTAAVVSSTGGEAVDIVPSSVTKLPGGSESVSSTRTDKESRSHVRSDSVGSQTQNGYGKGTTPILRHTESIDSSSCSICHIPYSESSVPFPVKMARCFLCKKSKVPDILLATIDLPPSIQTFGKSCLIQAQVYRPKRDCKGEVSAKEVSDSLPFLEYELHRRLINKLKVRGMNAIFALEVQICLGEKLMVGLATGTAVYVSCLPPSTYPKISAGNLKTDSQKVVQFQKVVQEVYEKNRATYGLKNVAPLHTGDNNQSGSEADDTIIDEDLPDIDLATGNKDTYVLEVDDAEDIDIIQVLIDPSPELGAYTLEPHMNNINFLHGFENCRVVSQQMFTQVWRCRISPLISLRQFTNYFDKLVQAVAFKLRRISPCVLSKLRYRVELPEQDEMQLSIIGLAVRLEEKPKNVTGDITISKTATDNDKEHDLPKSPGNLQPTNGVVPPSNGNTSNVSLDTNASYLTAAHSTTYGTHNVSPSGSIGTNQNPGFRFGLQNKTQLNPPRCIEITPLPHIPGGKIEKYLGNLNFFFIRETTSIRESGGLSGFVHNFIAEVLAIVRAHVAALGGNAMVSYFMTELSLLHNPHKNQGQCLVNIGGDVVRYSVIPNTVQEDL